MKRVLIVDDEPALTRLAVLLLRREGFEAIAAGGVQAALALPGPWDLLVVDRRLPNGDGQQVAAAYPDVPALTTSGYEPSDLPKPFSAAQFVAAVRERIAV